MLSKATNGPNEAGIGIKLKKALKQIIAFCS